MRFGPNAVPALNHQQVDLLSVADWSAIPGGKPDFNTVAVRNPHVHWNAGRAVFSMVIGAPASAADTTEFFWQLYEITLPTQAQLSASVKPVITKVANQPPYNNIMPCYAPDDQIIFSSDRPYNGLAHLRQREEYLGLPTVSGLWKLNPTSAKLQLLHHSPSGSFNASVDSSGRIVFVNWDHLSRDIEAMTDERDSDASFGEPAPDTFGGWHRTPNGSGNFADEGPLASFTPGVLWGTGQHVDTFPEPRNADKKTLRMEFPWGVDVNGTQTNVINGITTNVFMPWMIHLDGSGGELLNHVGRQEVTAGLIRKSFLTDSNIVDLNSAIAPGYGGIAVHNGFGNFFSIHEDPLNPGTYFGVDASDLGSHTAGRVIKLVNAGAGVNPDSMQVAFVTPSVAALPIVQVGMHVTSPPTPFVPLSSPVTVYRTPLPLKDGNLVASTASTDRADYNHGTLATPQSWFSAFRIQSLKPQSVGSSTYVPDVTLTSGITITSTYFVPGQAQAVTFTNVPAWELDPVEVISKQLPANVPVAVVDPIEAAAFTTAQVHMPSFQKWLTDHNYALSVSRNVLKRDRHDRQQPFNLRNVWSGQQAIATGTSGTVYNVAWSQFLQADLRRGYLLGGANPAPGRRVMAAPMHDGFSENTPAPGAPPGAVKLGNDSSVAAIVPAGKALTWHLLDNDANLTSQVRERFWVTFQPGEIRTCANCHGINTADQTGTNGPPVNTPQALLDLLAYWKTNHPPGTVQSADSLLSYIKSDLSADVTVQRTGGSMGPASVQYTTQNGSAVANTDFGPVSGTLNWADGDAAPKTVSIPLLHPTATGPTKAFSLQLSAPVYASLGAPASVAVNVTEAPLDAFLYTWFGNGANQAGGGLPGDDPDGDGQSNEAEFIAGTSPVDPASVLALHITMAADGQIHLSFQALAGKAYTIQHKVDLSEADWLIQANVPATGSDHAEEIVIPYGADATGFYRLVTPQVP